MSRNGPSNLLIICGGRSTEHSISLLSAVNVVSLLSQYNDYYHVHIAVIDRSGQWWKCDNLSKNLQSGEVDFSMHDPICIMPKGKILHQNSGKIENIDLAFICLHGNYGEDGSIQGWLENCDIPYVGCGILASGLGMDKEYCKQVLSANQIAVAPYISYKKGNPLPDYQEVCNKLGSKKLCIKPPCCGSSIGVSKVVNQAQYQMGISLALQYDKRILIEPYLEGRELECAIYAPNSKEIYASNIAEIHKPADKIYDYEEKYAAHSQTIVDVVHKSDPLITQLQKMAIEAFVAIGGRHLARIDFLLTLDNKVFVSEINTIPGFTNNSMYLKLWENDQGTQKIINAGELLHNLCQSTLLLN